MVFDDFIKQGWNDHGDRAPEVAERLASSSGLIKTAADISAFAKLVTHVYGEHLGRWSDGIALLESLRGLPAWDAAPAAAGAVAGGIAVLRCASGDGAALEQLPVEDRISALATVASTFMGRHETGRALAAFSSALQLARPGLPPGSPAFRALAVGGNNLASALESKTDRDDAETKGMIAAAEAGLKYWKLAGTWLEEERAEYRLARSLLQAGDPAGAMAAARRCIEVCEKHQAPPFERFFGHAVLAIAQRAAGDAAGFAESRGRALQCHENVPQDEKPWCETELKELGV